MYAEKAFVVINEKNKKRFQEVLMKRVKGLEKESQAKRVEKVLKKIQKIK